MKTFKQFVAEEYKLIKAHGGSRHLALHGGSMIGHIDRIPHVDLETMEADPAKDKHHAYAFKKRTSKNGIKTPYTKHLGAFDSHEEAEAAIKKHNKL